MSGAGEPHHKAPAGSCQLSGLRLLCVTQESWQLQDLPNGLSALPAFVTHLGGSLDSVCFQKFQACVLNAGPLGLSGLHVNRLGLWDLFFLCQCVWSSFRSELEPDITRRVLLHCLMTWMCDRPPEPGRQDAGQRAH